jgi:hypothetical protein
VGHTFFGAAAFFAFGAAAFFSAGAFLGAAAGFFAFVSVFAAASFFGAAAFLAAGFLAVVVAAPSFFATGLAAGLAAFFASFVPPDGPFGCSKTPFSTPVFRALLKRESNCASLVVLILLFALTYFFRDCRL